jgi:hypothetical protein
MMDTGNRVSTKEQGTMTRAIASATISITLQDWHNLYDYLTTDAARESIAEELQDPRCSPDDAYPITVWAEDLPDVAQAINAYNAHLWSTRENQPMEQ